MVQFSIPPPLKKTYFGVWDRCHWIRLEISSRFPVSRPQDLCSEAISYMFANFPKSSKRLDACLVVGCKSSRRLGACLVVGCKSSGRLGACLVVGCKSSRRLDACLVVGCKSSRRLDACLVVGCKSSSRLDACLVVGCKSSSCFPLPNGP